MTLSFLNEFLSTFFFDLKGSEETQALLYLEKFSDVFGFDLYSSESLEQLMREGSLHVNVIFALQLKNLFNKRFMTFDVFVCLLQL